MKDTYNINDELKQKYDDFDFASHMQDSARNEVWKNKEALWTILSAACNDAASKCYNHINSYSGDMTDIETCPIHTLKSLAKSVDLEYLVTNIKENYPSDIMELLNLLSIPRYILLFTNEILHDDSNIKIFGKITRRSSKIFVKKVTSDLLYNIKIHIYQLQKLLEVFMINDVQPIFELLKYDLPDLKIKLSNINYDLNIKNDNFLNSFFNLGYNPEISNPLSDDAIQQCMLNSSLKDVINGINSIYFDDLKKYEEQKLIINDDGKPKYNYFYILINVIKQNFYNSEYDYTIIGKYTDDEGNEVDLQDLIVDIVGAINNNDEHYINDFINYHFFNVIKDKLYNDNLRKLYYFNKDLKTTNVRDKIYMKNDIKSDYSKEDFIKKISNFLSPDDVNKFIELNKITAFNQYIIDFVEYLSFINSYNSLYNKTDEIPYDLISINFNNIFSNELYNNLFEKFNDKFSIVGKLSKELTDVAIQISYIRDEIQENIQKYGYIGTKKIVTDTLNEFFIKNFSKNDDWSFHSNLLINVDDDLVESIFKPVSSLINTERNKDKFLIDIIEYYDTTNYLNISSDIGNVKVGEKIIGYEESIEYSLDMDNMIVSSTIDKPLYQDVYMPCSNFIGGLNKRFWEDDELITYDNYSDYENFFKKYDKDLQLNEDNNEKIKYLNSSLKPFLNRLWDTFALSSFSGESNEFDELYVKYIGKDEGENKYFNNYNEIFPTIAPIQYLNGLVEISNEKSDILFVCKAYYENVLNVIKLFTSKIIKMYDENGVPFDNWKQSYINFHGYSSKYNNSLKLTMNGQFEDKNINVDGPWVYSDLRKLYYETLSCDDEQLIKNIDYFIRYVDVIDDSKYSLKSIYKNYILSKKFIKSLSELNIEKVENDIFLNTWTLMKNDDDLFGKIFFRSYEMTISLPLFNENFLSTDDLASLDFSNNTNLEILKSICNKCVDFGIYEEYVWVYGCYENGYRLCSFKIDFDYNHIIIFNDSITYYSMDDSLILDIRNLNDFIGVYKNEELNKLNFILINSASHLVTLTKEKTELLKYNISFDISSLLENGNINLLVYSLDLNTNIFVKESINVKNIVFPALLNIDNSFVNDHRLWKLTSYNDRNYICYEALNVNEIDSLKENYFNFKENSLKFEIINIKWNLSNIQGLIGANNIIISKSKYDSIIFNNLDSDDNINLKNELSIFLNSYPKCYIKDGNLNLDLAPFSLKPNLKKEEINELINEIINYCNNINYITFLNGNNEIKYEDDTIINSMSLLDIIKNNNILSSVYNELNNFNSYLCGTSGINDEFANSYNFVNNSIISSLLNCSFNPKSDSSLLYKTLSVSQLCLNEPLKIIIKYKNETTANFVHDWALDVDVTCFINDIFEKNKKVGYGNRYKETSYISWSGDKQSEGSESFTIDVVKYINDVFLNKNINDNLEIVLNTCWHDSAELMGSNVTVLINWQNIVDEIKLSNVGISKKECNNRSLVINVDMKNKILTYEEPKGYFVLKIARKQLLDGFTNGIPDIQVGLLNLTFNELNNLENAGWNNFNEKYLIYYNKDTKNEVDFISILLKDEILYDANDNIILSIIRSILDKNIYIDSIIGSNNKHSSLILNDIYFGINSGNSLDESGINIIYYSYLHPKYFKTKKKEKYQILVGCHQDLYKILNHEYNKKEEEN